VLVDRLELLDVLVDRLDHEELLALLVEMLD
jgi:hypothetical protein